MTPASSWTRCCPARHRAAARLGQQPLSPAGALRLGTELRADYPAELVAAALAQHELRIAARAKFSRAM